jgi:hypothetical protein
MQTHQLCAWRHEEVQRRERGDKFYIEKGQVDELKSKVQLCTSQLVTMGHVTPPFLASAFLKCTQSKNGLSEDNGKERKGHPVGASCKWRSPGVCHFLISLSQLSQAGGEVSGSG